MLLLDGATIEAIVIAPLFGGVTRALLCTCSYVDKVMVIEAFGSKRYQRKPFGYEPQKIRKPFWIRKIRKPFGSKIKIKKIRNPIF